MIEPRIRIEPKGHSTDGQGAALLMAEYGVTLDDWQQLVLNAWLLKDHNENYICTSCGLTTPRQNGKNCILEARELYGLLINGERILHTAHQVRTCKASFRRLANIFSDRSHPEIIKAVKRVHYGTGEERIELKNGGRIEFIARSRQAARGYDGISLVVFDEAQELEEEQIEALLATLSASATGTRQIIYTGTAPYVGCSGTVFRRFRDSCILGAAENKTTAWHEWGIAADKLQDIDLSDRKLWQQANPALNKRLTEEFTAEEFKTLSAEGFARERLNFWAKPAEITADLAIDPDLWDSCGSDEVKPTGKTAYGVKFTPDGAEVVLAGCVIPKEGKPRIELIAIEPTGNGLSWLAEWLNARYKVASCVVIDGKNGCDVLIDKISPVWRLKGTIIKPNAQNVVTAAQGLLNDLHENALTWYKEQTDLRDSAITSTKRAISGGWGFGGQASAPIEAASLALWGCKSSKRDPQRKMLIG